jgi:hypothetical protein
MGTLTNGKMTTAFLNNQGHDSSKHETISSPKKKKNLADCSQKLVRVYKIIKYINITPKGPKAISRSILKFG